MSSPAHYHALQFEIQADPRDPRNIPFELPESCRSWLDVGCGAGALLHRIVPLGTRAVGVDVDLPALQFGRRMKVGVPLACSPGESLPFRSGSFDFVSSRVALPYMNIPKALAEFARVLTPGGRLWVVLHPLSRFDPAQAFSAPKHLAYEVYRLVNTAAFHLGGPQFRCPEPRRRCESYQTESGMRRALVRAGFVEIVSSRNPYFVVTAVKHCC